MSGLLAGKVWQSSLDPRLKPLAAALADIANDDGTNIYPSVAYTAWLLGDDTSTTAEPRMTRTVQRGMADLESMGVLKFIGWKRGENTRTISGKGTTREYRLIEAALPTRPRWQSRYGEDGLAISDRDDILSPLDKRGVTKVGRRGDKTSPGGVTKMSQRGDTGVTQTVLDPSYGSVQGSNARARATPGRARHERSQQHPVDSGRASTPKDPGSRLAELRRINEQRALLDAG